MKKGKKRLLTSLLAVALVMACCFGFSMNASAYWFFGTVGLSLGKSSVSLTSGQSETVSVSLSPASSDQLLGCGMEECPRICGEKNCYNNEYGQCICNGSTLTTYYPTATVSSNDTSVATATYNGGTITINAVSAGEATITVVGSLRQYYDSPEQTIAVTVSANTGGWSAPVDSSGQTSGSSSGNTGSSGNSGNSGNSGSSGSSGSSGNTGNTGNTSNTGNSGNSGNTGNSDNSGDTIAATQVAGTENVNTTGDAGGEIEEIEGEEENTEGEAEEDAEEDDGITKIESDKGTIWFVPITGLPQGKEQFEMIMGDESQYVDFQLKDDAGNVVYAWEFLGSDVERAEDMVFTIESSQEAFEGCSYGSPDSSLYLTFSEEGEFVGKTSIFYRVSDYFADSDILYLYLCNPEDDSIQLAAEGLTVSSGYVTLPLTEGGYYILTTEELMDAPEGMEEEIMQQPEEVDVDSMAGTEDELAEDNTGLSVGAIVAIIIVIAAAAAAVIIFLAVRAVRKKKKGPGGDGTGEDESEFWVEAGEEGDGDASGSPEESDRDVPESPEGSGEEESEEGTREE